MSTPGFQPPSKRQFIDDHANTLYGMIADGLVHDRDGAQLAMWLRQKWQQLVSELGNCYDQLVPSPPPEVPPAGTSKPPEKKK